MNEGIGTDGMAGNNDYRMYSSCFDLLRILSEYNGIRPI